MCCVDVTSYWLCSTHNAVTKNKAKQKKNKMLNS